MSDIISQLEEKRGAARMGGFVPAGRDQDVIVRGGIRTGHREDSHRLLGGFRLCGAAREKAQAARVPAASVSARGYACARACERARACAWARLGMCDCCASAPATSVGAGGSGGGMRREACV